jgi:hypothetical protein
MFEFILVLGENGETSLNYPWKNKSSKKVQAFLDLNLK